MWEHHWVKEETCKALWRTARLRKDRGRCGNGWSCWETGCCFTMSTAEDPLTDETVRPRTHSLFVIWHFKTAQLIFFASVLVWTLSLLLFPAYDVIPRAKALGQSQRMEGRPCRSTKIKKGRTSVLVQVFGNASRLNAPPRCGESALCLLLSEQSRKGTSGDASKFFFGTYRPKKSTSLNSFKKQRPLTTLIHCGARDTALIPWKALHVALYLLIRSEWSRTSVLQMEFAHTENIKAIRIDYEAMFFFFFRLKLCPLCATPGVFHGVFAVAMETVHGMWSSTCARKVQSTVKQQPQTMKMSRGRNVCTYLVQGCFLSCWFKKSLLRCFFYCRKGPKRFLQGHKTLL